MLDTACREADSVLLDCRYFALPEEAFKRFTSILDSPPKDNPRLRPTASDESVALGRMSGAGEIGPPE